MTAKKPPKKNSIERTLDPVSVSKEKAYEVFVELFCNLGGNISLRKCHAEIMRRDPKAKLSYNTMTVWAKAHDWQTRAAEILRDEIVKALTPYKPAMTDDALCGLQGQMIMHIHKSIDEADITAPVNLLTFLEAIEKLGQLRNGSGAMTSGVSDKMHSARLAEVIGNVRQLKPKK